MEYPNIDPVVISIGPLNVHWYGMMYLFAFLAGWLLGRKRALQYGWTKAQVDDFITWIMLGIILGARIGYVIFYDFSTFSRDPIEIFRLWNGGMSFHGGLLGVLTATYFWGKKNGKSFLEILDFIAPLSPTGLFFGRIGNFINAELWGKVTDCPLGMVFPGAGHLPRHPSQLYEAGLEGIFLFIVLWVFSSKKRPTGAVAGLFGVVYSCCRIFVEFFRLPDPQLGYILFGWLTMGQILCMPLLIFGAWLIFRAYRK